jgi:hypothetical protein
VVEGASVDSGNGGVNVKCLNCQWNLVDDTDYCAECCVALFDCKSCRQVLGVVNA